MARTILFQGDIITDVDRKDEATGFLGNGYPAIKMCIRDSLSNAVRNQYICNIVGNFFSHRQNPRLFKRPKFIQNKIQRNGDYQVNQRCQHFRDFKIVNHDK